MTSAQILGLHADQLLAQAIALGREGRFDAMQRVRSEAAVARRIADEARQAAASGAARRKAA